MARSPHTMSFLSKPLENKAKEPNWKPFGILTRVQEIEDELGFPAVVLTSNKEFNDSAIIKQVQSENTRADIERDWLLEDIEVYVIKKEVKVMGTMYDYQITSIRDIDADMTQEFREPLEDGISQESRFRAEAMQAKEMGLLTDGWNYFGQLLDVKVSNATMGNSGRWDKRITITNSFGQRITYHYIGAIGGMMPDPNVIVKSLESKVGKALQVKLVEGEYDVEMLACFSDFTVLKKSSDDISRRASITGKYEQYDDEEFAELVALADKNVNADLVALLKAGHQAYRHSLSEAEKIEELLAKQLDLHTEDVSMNTAAMNEAENAMHKATYMLTEAQNKVQKHLEDREQIENHHAHELNKLNTERVMHTGTIVDIETRFQEAIMRNQERQKQELIGLADDILDDIEAKEAEEEREKQERLKGGIASVLKEDARGRVFGDINEVSGASDKGEKGQEDDLWKDKYIALLEQSMQQLKDSNRLKTKNEFSDMFRGISEAQIKAMRTDLKRAQGHIGDEERKAHSEKLSKIGDKLFGAKDIKVEGHSAKELAIRFGIDPRDFPRKKILQAVIVKKARNDDYDNTYEIEFNNNKSGFVALGVDDANYIFAFTFLHPHEKWKATQQNITGIGAKSDLDITIDQCLEFNAKIEAKLGITS